jgi:hypothetical protein
MLLEKDQKRYLSMLTIGRCICRSDRMVEPLLLSIPDFPIKKGIVSDEDLKKRMDEYLPDLTPHTPPLPKSSDVRSVQTQQTLSPLGRIVLENIALKPFLGLVKRFKELGLKLSQGYKVIEELTARQLVTPLTIDGNRLYDLTPGGKNILGQKRNHPGRGGLEHRYWVDKIKAHYLGNEGFTFLEKDDIDLVVETVDRQLALQVETGKSNIQANLTKLGRYGADLKYVVTTNPETEIRTKEMLSDLLVPDRENIRILFVKDFLSNPPVI